MKRMIAGIYSLFIVFLIFFLTPPVFYLKQFCLRKHKYPTKLNCMFYPQMFVIAYVIENEIFK